MSGLERRLKKLEAGSSKDENIVCAQAPIDWTDGECRERAQELVGDRFNGEEFTLSVSRATDIDDFKVLFAATGKELDEVMRHIGENPRRITDLNSKTGQKE